MTCDELVESFLARTEAVNARIRAAVDERGAVELWKNSSSGEWSPGQILEHLTMTHGHYIAAIENALAKGPLGVEEARHSWFGRTTAKGLKGSKPVPTLKRLHPGKIANENIYFQWAEQQKKFISLAESARGRRLSSTRVSNPFIRIIPMNAADCFEIVASHNEYHAKQIEDRLGCK